MKHKLTVLVALSAALTLAGCSQNTQGGAKSSQSQSKTSQVSKKSSSAQPSAKTSSQKDGTKLSADDMDYKTTASAIAVYAAQKYGDTWEIAVNAAKQNNLSIAFRSKSATGITADNNGYVYEVSGTGKSSNARYMLGGGDGANKQVTIFVKQRNLGTVSLGNIVSYLNSKGAGNTVKSLAQNAKLGAKLAGDVDESKTSPVQHNNASSVIPSALQGTWYTADTGNGNIDTLTVTDNKINDEAGFSMDVQKKNTGSSGTNSGYMKQANINGINFYSFTNMGQQPGQGSTYLAPHTENGQQVIVSANSNGRTNAVYWKSETLAKKNANKQFSDLKY